MQLIRFYKSNKNGKPIGHLNGKVSFPTNAVDYRIVYEVIEVISKSKVNFLRVKPWKPENLQHVRDNGVEGYLKIDVLKVDQVKIDDSFNVKKIQVCATIQYSLNGFLLDIIKHSASTFTGEVDFIKGSSMSVTITETFAMDQLPLSPAQKTFWCNFLSKKP